MYFSPLLRDKPLTQAWGLAIFVLLTSHILPAVAVNASEVRVIYPGQEPTMEGKEVDWIYGDYLMSNDVISLIIAAPIETRDANLTVREIGASILDLTTNEPVGDQLSAFVPAAGRYQFFDASKVQTGMEGETAYWQCSSSKSLTNDETVATVRYELMPDASFVRATVMIRGEKAGDVQPFDGIRADRTFQFDVLTDSPVQAAFCRDAFFQATIGFVCPETDTAPQWGGNRMKEL